MTGKFIVFEGIDGVGKTTLSLLLSKQLKQEGYRVKHISEFPADYLDGYIQKALKESKFFRSHHGFSIPLASTFMLLSAHAYKFETNVKPFLKKGYVIVSDRYFDSVLAYQIPLLQSEGINESFSETSLFHYLGAATSLFRPPDLTILLQCDSNEILGRLEMRGDSVNRDDLTFLKKVDKVYEQIYYNNKYRYYLYENNGKIRDAVNDIYSLITARVGVHKWNYKLKLENL